MLFCEKRLDKLWQEYESSVFQVATAEWNKSLVPFCKKHKCSFVAGNGTWWIEHNNFYSSEDFLKETTEGRRLLAILQAEVPGFRSNDLGSLMPDYKVEK